ncbi:MAG: alpha/beta hydrolase [Stenotrophomonas sp.]
MWMLGTLMAAAAVAHAGEVPVNRGAYILQAEQTGAGPITVVFESGFGQGAGAWKAVIAALGPGYRTIAYARAGLGTSGTDGQPKRIDDHLTDLGAVMDALAPGQAVVLVGHSYGGLLATEFARRHPERVRGLVLVDPATLGQRHAFKQAHAARVLADDTALLAVLPPSLAGDYRTLVAQLDAPGAATPRTMPDVPVALLTATAVAEDPFVLEETAEGKAIWKAQHAQLFAAFVRGSHRYVATGHTVQREDPAAVVAAIAEVSGTPVTAAH